MPAENESLTDNENKLKFVACRNSADRLGNDTVVRSRASKPLFAPYYVCGGIIFNSEGTKIKVFSVKLEVVHNQRD